MKKMSSWYAFLRFEESRYRILQIWIFVKNPVFKYEFLWLFIYPWITRHNLDFELLMQYMTNIIQLPGRLGGGSPRRMWSSGCKLKRTMIISMMIYVATKILRWSKCVGRSWWKIPLLGKLAPRQDDRSVIICITILIKIDQDNSDNYVDHDLDQNCSN